MDKIFVMARAPTRALGLAFMEATGVAEQDQETGMLNVLVDAVITTSDGRDGTACGWGVSRVTGVDEFGANITEPMTGYFVNIIYHSDSAQALQEGGDPEAEDLFDLAPGLLMLSEARTGKPMVWTALSEDQVPPGYQNADGIRLYDPQFIVTPANVIA